MEDLKNEGESRKRYRTKEKVKIHYRKRVKLKHRPSKWVRLMKYIRKNERTMIVLGLLITGVIVVMTGVFLTVKQKSDKNDELKELKYTPPVGKK